MLIRSQPAKERACKVRSLARFALCSVHGVRPDAALKGNRSLTTLWSNLYGHAMPLGLPKYALEHAGHTSGSVSKGNHAPVNCGRHTVDTVASARRLFAWFQCANTGNQDSGQG